MHSFNEIIGGLTLAFKLAFKTNHTI